MTKKPMIVCDRYGHGTGCGPIDHPPKDKPEDKKIDPNQNGINVNDDPYEVCDVSEKCRGPGVNRLKKRCRFYNQLYRILLFW